LFVRLLRALVNSESPPAPPDRQMTTPFDYDRNPERFRLAAR
jgi:hypothetical protein